MAAKLAQVVIQFIRILHIYTMLITYLMNTAILLAVFAHGHIVGKA